jgi:PAS domain S-box-containing protein
MTTISTIMALRYWIVNRTLQRLLCRDAGDAIDFRHQSGFKQRLLNAGNKMGIRLMELRQREEEFRAIAENTSDTIERYDRNCRRIYANNSLKRLLGDNGILSKTPEETYGSSLSSMGYQRAIDESIATGKEGEYTLCWEAPDEQTYWLHISIVPERDVQGNVLTILAIGRDISGLLESDQRMQESLDLLRKLLVHQEVSNVTRQKWASWEVYDSLGQLLFVQRMDVEFLKRNTFTDVATLNAHLDKMLTLIDKAIDVVRSVSAELRPTAFNMGVALALGWIVEEFRKETDIACELDLEEEEILLDEACANMLYHVIQSALENIVLHAVAKQVSITLERDTDYYVLQIRDDGEGMDLEAPQEVNLRLYYIQELVHASGGEVVLLSQQGEGSLLDVRLPVKRTPE